MIVKSILTEIILYTISFFKTPNQLIINLKLQELDKHLSYYELVLLFY